MDLVLGGGCEGCWDHEEPRGDCTAECSSCVCQTLLKASGWSMVSLRQPGLDGKSVSHDFSRFVLWASRALMISL